MKVLENALFFLCKIIYTVLYSKHHHSSVYQEMKFTNDKRMIVSDYSTHMSLKSKEKALVK